MPSRTFYIINTITVYRILAAPFLIYMVFTKQVELYKWMLAFSFFTDAIDGFLARKFKAASALGARLDSIADDLTVTAGIFGIFILRPQFVEQEVVLITVMLTLLFVEILLAFIRYRKMTSFHTYIAKIAAILQAVFIVLIFFCDEPPYLLFYIAAAFTIINLIEEIILIFMLPVWESDVKGLFWVIKREKEN